MKTARNIFLFAALVVVAAVTVLAAWTIKDIRTPGPYRGERVRITIEPGAGFAHIADQLAARGLIARTWTLKVFARLTGDDRRVQRGTYQFASGTAPADILHAFVRGDVLAFLVTIPEGFNVWQVAGAFDSTGVDSLELLAVCTDAQLAQTVTGVSARNLDGYLFPDTYRIPFGATARDVTEQMVTRARAAWSDEYARRAEEMGMTRHEALTLASIVEAEARVSDERPTIAAVYHNRLRKGMRLEADPTVAYAMGGYRGRLFYKDLAIDSPYNTYQRTGLPPGPICNPGDASIRAALFPAQGVDALYFVARGDGRHIFSTTLRQHHAAVREARRNSTTRRSNGS
jgi:UPF0755 protein